MCCSVLLAKHTWKVFQAIVDFIALDEFEESICINFTCYESEIRAHKFKSLGILLGELCNCIKEQCKNGVDFIFILADYYTNTFVLRSHKIKSLS